MESELSRSVRKFDANRQMRRLRNSVLKKYGPDLDADRFCFVIDDTSNPRYGKGVHGVGVWGSSQGTYFGQKILVIALVDRVKNIAIPIDYAFARKKDDGDYKSMHELAVDSLVRLKQQGFPAELPVTCDSWFDGAAFMKQLKDHGFTFAGEIKSNRLVKLNPGRSVPWVKIGVAFKPLKKLKIIGKRRGNDANPKYISESVGLIRGYKSSAKIIGVYNKRTGNVFAFYLSTDRTMAGAKLWALSRSRWAIECLFRDLKQQLSFGCLACVGEKAANLAVCIPFTIITSLRIDDPEVWGEATRSKTIGTMLAKIRAINNDQALAEIIQRPQGPLVLRLQARRQLQRTNRKPANMPAAVRRQGAIFAA